MAIEKIPIVKETFKPTAKKKMITNAFLIADIHLGVRMGSEEWRENAKEYFEQFLFPLLNQHKNENSIVLCLGDIFDDRKSINIAVNDLAIDIFEKMAKILPVYIINGNHDMYKKSNNDITSLRSFDNIPNLHIIKDPTLLTLKDKTWSKNLMFIPFQGDMERETNLVNQNADADYMFMHTDIKNLKYDNNMNITMGVDTSAVKGTIYSGHIHRRQVTPKVIYIGSPYQLRRSDIDNQKGIYQLDFETGKTIFFENHISPIFLKVALKTVQDATDKELEETFSHNYVDVVVKEDELRRLKVGELYDKLNIFNPKRIEIKVKVNEEFDFFNEDDAENYKEKSIEEIIETLIDEMENIEKPIKERIKEKSKEYQKLAMIEEDI